MRDFNNLSFDILYKDRILTSVTIKDGVVSIEKFDNRVGFQPFVGGPVDLARIKDYFKSRCFNPARPDKNELLAGMGLTEYDPLRIVEYTHGRMFHDYTWIRFCDESLCWEDVALGQD